MAETLKAIAGLSCPAPLPAKDTVLLGHGSGGTLSADLIREIFLPGRRRVLTRRRSANVVAASLYRIRKALLVCIESRLAAD